MRCGILPAMTSQPSAQPPEQPVVLLLGPIDVRVGTASAAIGGAKVRAVLAQLALASGSVVSTDTLIDGVWGEDPPATAANTLQYHVGVLRKALAAAGVGDAIETRPPGYVFSRPTDLGAFTGLRRAAEAAGAADPGTAARLYRQALDWWRGPALADLLRFPFAAAKAVTLEEQRLQAVEGWIDAELGCGRGEDLVADLEGLVADNPTRERLWKQLMTALYRGGRQADALEAFSRARRLLDEELGVDPSPELKATHAAVLRQDSALLAKGRARPAAGITLGSSPTRLKSSLPATKGTLVLPDGGRHALSSHPATLGRSADCDVVVADERVSRRHARVVMMGDGHAVEDLASTNGTYLNGARVAVLTRLGHGDRIEVGNQVLRYEADGSDEPELMRR